MSLKRKARKLERTEKNSVTIFETILVTYRMYVVNLIKSKNTEEIIRNHKGTRMVEDEKDCHGLQTTNLKSLS